MSVSLEFGAAGRFACEMNPDRIVISRSGPAPHPHLAEKLQSVLENPLDFPPLREAVVPGDRISLALDNDTPGAPLLVAGLWKVFEQRDVNPADVTIVQSAGLRGSRQVDPRTALPESVRDQVVWQRHDPTDEASCRYLASSVAGERIYLAGAIIEADLVIPVGKIGFDPVLGYSGTSSVLYPGLSTTAAIAKAHGQGHSELGPDDQRPLRQVMDEVAWLLGIQFSVQVIPASGGGASQVLAGSSDAVFRRGRDLLNQHWRVRLEERCEIVVAAVDAEPGGQSWEQVGAALETARSLVARDGKIVILSELSAELGEGLTLIRDSRSPRDALQPLRSRTPPDLVAATQLATAVDWADVYLLSRLDSALVEDLFLIPLESEHEVQRLLGGQENCVFLGSAQHAYGEVGPA